MYPKCIQHTNYPQYILHITEYWFAVNFQQMLPTTCLILIINEKRNLFISSATLKQLVNVRSCHLVFFPAVFLSILLYFRFQEAVHYKACNAPFYTCCTPKNQLYLVCILSALSILNCILAFHCEHTTLC